MFSPDNTLQSINANSTRNPRRRQRKDSGSVRHEPQRKRSRIADDLFSPPLNAKVNGNGVLGMNGYAGHGEVVANSQKLDMPVREKKGSATGKRASKGDGSTILVCPQLRLDTLKLLTVLFYRRKTPTMLLENFRVTLSVFATTRQVRVSKTQSFHLRVCSELTRTKSQTHTEPSSSRPAPML